MVLWEGMYGHRIIELGQGEGRVIAATGGGDIELPSLSRGTKGSTAPSTIDISTSLINSKLYRSQINFVTKKKKNLLDALPIVEYCSLFNRVDIYVTPAPSIWNF